MQIRGKECMSCLCCFCVKLGCPYGKAGYNDPCWVKCQKNTRPTLVCRKFLHEKRTKVYRVVRKQSKVSTLLKKMSAYELLKLLGGGIDDTKGGG